MPRLQASSPPAANDGDRYKSWNKALSTEPPPPRHTAKEVREQMIKDELQPRVQQVHIVSSGDEMEADTQWQGVTIQESHAERETKVLSAHSLSGSLQSDFAGFDSPHTTLQTGSPNYSTKLSLKQASCNSTGGQVNEANLSNKISPLKRACSSELCTTDITPMKKSKKQFESEPLPAMTSGVSYFQTPTDQIVEIDSNSTSNTKKQNRLQLQLGSPQSRNHQQQPYHTLKHTQLLRNNQATQRRSTESSSDLPVSSPSNPLVDGGGKYPKRPPMLKNTLPADAFERNLALITSRHPQMTLGEKMMNWQCETELSDVEDVNNFDDLFRKHEQQKRKQPHSNKRSVSNKAELYNKSDFMQFRAKLQSKLLEERKCTDRGRSCESEKPTTSAAAASSMLPPRRTKGLNNNKSRNNYQNLSASQQRAQRYTSVKPNSTFGLWLNSPIPQSTSSSSIITEGDDEDEYFENNYDADVDKDASYAANVKDAQTKYYADSAPHMIPKKQQHHVPHFSKKTSGYNKINSVKNLEETSQVDSAMRSNNYTHSTALPSILTAPNNKHPRLSANPFHGNAAMQRVTIDADASNTHIDGIPLQWVQNTVEHAEENVQRKQPQQYVQNDNSAQGHQCGLIQMRLDFLSEKKDLRLRQKTIELFKTPTVPQKYNAGSSSMSPSPTTRNQRKADQDNNDGETIDNKNEISSHSDMGSEGDGDGDGDDDRELQNLKSQRTEIGSKVHQQHEFCNYLGLTGMSTANAMANAVAELAKCNINRRSLRVQRLQHQEKRELSEKRARDAERKGLQILKVKQLRELQRREPENKCNDNCSSVCGVLTRRSYSQGEAVPANGPNLRTEPGIKILCQLSSTDKAEAEQITRSYAKRLVEPIRKTLMHQLHIKRATAGNDSSNGTSTLPHSYQSGPEEHEQKPFLPAIAPTSAAVTRRNVHEMNNAAYGGAISPARAHIKAEPLPSCAASQSTQRSESPAKSLARTPDMQEKLLRKGVYNHELTTKQPASTQLQPELLYDRAENQTHQNMLRNKFQNCLEVSRKTKPSIFIVKSFASARQLSDASNSTLTNASQTTVLHKDKSQQPPATAQTQQNADSRAVADVEDTLVGCATATLVKPKAPLKAHSRTSLHKRNSTGRFHKLLTRSTHSMRQLRNRKIYFVKSKKRAPTKEKSTEKVDKATITCNVAEKISCPMLSTPENKATDDMNDCISMNTPLIPCATKTMHSISVGTNQHVASNDCATQMSTTKMVSVGIKAEPAHADCGTQKSDSRAKTTGAAQTSEELQRQQYPVRAWLMRTKQDNATTGKLSTRRNVTQSEQQVVVERLRQRYSMRTSANTTQITRLRQKSTAASATATTGAPYSPTPQQHDNTHATGVAPMSASNRAAISPTSSGSKPAVSPANKFQNLPPSPPPPPSSVVSLQRAEHDASELLKTMCVTVEPTPEPLTPEATPPLQPMEIEPVIVSSTTNTFDESMLSHNSGSKSSNNNNNNNISSELSCQVTPTTKEIYKNMTYRETKESVLATHSESAGQSLSYSEQSTVVSVSQAPNANIHYLSQSSKALKNPLQRTYGEVLYVYYELDVLIAVQQQLVSMWKYSKLINVLALMSSSGSSGVGYTATNAHETKVKDDVVDISGEWLQLGECKRSNNDDEVITPYANRICMHSSMPIYVEMRCRQLSRERRDCNLLSMYINIYYYHDDEMQAKMHSIQLDTVQSLPHNVIYTTIPESRYFVMSWPQENILGKIRSGLCKYSLTPTLDTLASIREFKSMRYELVYLECIADDKLLGFGKTQLSIWDHRSGDVLMNYDLDLPLGRNLGSIYYPSLDIGQNSMILLFQHVEVEERKMQLAQNNMQQQQTEDAQQQEQKIQPKATELLIIACNISHATPTHRVLQRQQLPQPAFSTIKSTINLGEHLIITANSDEEIWINCTDPNVITCVGAQNTNRFYTRGRSQLIEMTDETLRVDSFANHVLRIAVNTALPQIANATQTI